MAVNAGAPRCCFGATPLVGELPRSNGQTTAWPSAPSRARGGEKGLTRQIGGWVVIGPSFGEALVVAAGDLEARCHLRNLEAGRDHDDIGGAFLAVGCDDPIMRKMVDRIGDQFYIGFCQGLEP